MSYERLTTVDKNGYIDITGIWDVDMRREDERKYHAAKSRLAELEDMIEDGQAIIMPCKVGDTVYYIRNGLIYFSTISKIEILGNSIMFSMDDHYYGYTVSFYGYEFGKRIFFTPEEAEEKLEELKNE